MNFSALEMRLRSICDDLGLVRRGSADAPAGSNTSDTRRRGAAGGTCPAAARTGPRSRTAGVHDRLTGLDSARSSRSLTSRQSYSAPTADDTIWRSCSSVSGPSARSSSRSQRASIEFRAFAARGSCSTGSPTWPRCCAAAPRRCSSSSAYSATTPRLVSSSSRLRRASSSCARSAPRVCASAPGSEAAVHGSDRQLGGRANRRFR